MAQKVKKNIRENKCRLKKSRQNFLTGMCESVVLLCQFLINFCVNFGRYFTQSVLQINVFVEYDQISMLRGFSYLSIRALSSKLLNASDKITWNMDTL